jgi:TetR/AcrR family transcriptional regulator, transcriptional repressor for nem operon
LIGIRKFDEEELLEDALELFWRQGAAATSMLDLAAATGVQRGSLYHAYGDKEVLFLRAYDRYAARFLSKARARASLEGVDAGRMLSRFFEMDISAMTAGTPPRGCLTTKTAGDGSLASDKIRQRLRNMLSELTALVEEALSRPGVRAQLVLDPVETARVVVTFTRGLGIMERIHGDKRALMRAASSLIQALVIHRS